MNLVKNVSGHIEEWFDETKTQRKLKAGIVAACKAYTPTMTVITLFTIFAGSLTERDFPHLPFWIVVSLTAYVSWMYYKEKVLKEKYTMPRMIDHETLDGSLIFYFRNRKDLKEHTIVEIRRMTRKRSQPYAIGYVNRQDDVNKKLVIVYPLAFAYGSKYQTMEPHPKFKGKDSEYVLCIGPLRTDVYDCLDIGGGHKHGKN